mmetsp:Transcript_3605/g.7980  ORF Transcript_3605/g.7980 Transcript_3605/m.7980 type:complete len:87 (-) Transcript_3605:939-1199(-)
MPKMTDGKKKHYHQGHDIKSLLINLATLFLFVLPFALYFDGESNGINYICVVAGSFVLAFLAPPVGMLRPHVYSDFQWNKPFPRRD